MCIRDRVEAVADVTSGAWLDALPVASRCLLGDGDVLSSLRYMLGVCPAVMQNKPLVVNVGSPSVLGRYEVSVLCGCSYGVPCYFR